MSGPAEATGAWLIRISTSSLVDRVDRAAVVGHGQLRGVDPGRGVGAHHLAAEGRLALVAEVPAIGRDLAVGIERVAGVEGHRIARRREQVRARAGDRRRVDHDLGLVVVDRLVLGGVVAHAEAHAVDARAGRRCSGPGRRSASAPSLNDHRYSATSPSGSIEPWRRRRSAPGRARRSGRARHRRSAPR